MSLLKRKLSDYYQDYYYDSDPSDSTLYHDYYVSDRLGYHDYHDCDHDLESKSSRELGLTEDRMGVYMTSTMAVLTLVLVIIGVALLSDMLLHGVLSLFVSGMKRGFHTSLLLQGKNIPT